MCVYFIRVSSDFLMKLRVGEREYPQYILTRRRKANMGVSYLSLPATNPQ